MRFGETEPLLEDSASVMAYQRRLGTERLVVLGNFSPETQYLVLPEGVEGAGRALVWSHGQRDRLDRSLKLAPFESVAVLIDT
ncbi:hypothetical protein G0P98_23760 [Yangia sp. PrR004]|nr:hypothetical protein [Salipiger sp. PrR004]